MNKKPTTLSKSRVTKGLQCTKALYLSVHNPELIPEVSPEKQKLFDQGHAVGKRAQELFPGGVEITAPYYDHARAATQTAEAIASGANTIYEATFFKDGLSARIDIFHRASSSDAWQLFEVKSTTSVKSEHLPDVAIQVLVVEAAGHKVEKAVLMHLNNKCVAPNFENLFIQQDVSKEITGIKAMLPKKLTEFKAALERTDPPTTDIGPHCEDPYECDFKDHCWKHIQSPSIFEIPRIGAKAWNFYKEGVVNVSDERFVPTKAQEKYVKAMRSGRRLIDKEKIADELSSWNWPLYFLDFETISYAIPVHDGTRPYENIPFQFSCLIQYEPGGPIEERAYLHDKDTDPRPEVIEALLRACKGSGPIVAYNMGFEKTCIDSLARFSPAHAQELTALTNRLVDPLPIFRSSVYDSAFKGSFSIKAVAPALLGSGRSYENLEVQNGTQTQIAFLELIDQKTTHDRRTKLRMDMLEYCRKDTQEMVDLVSWLWEQANEHERRKRA